MNIEFKDPWKMMALENADAWIELVKNSLKTSDPLFGKQIFVSGIHESKKILIVDNDTDNSYAIVSVEKKKQTQSFSCATVELMSSRDKLATKMKKDHDHWLSQWA